MFGIKERDGGLPSLRIQYWTFLKKHSFIEVGLSNNWKTFQKVAWLLKLWSGILHILFWILKFFEWKLPEGVYYYTTLDRSWYAIVKTVPHIVVLSFCVHAFHFTCFVKETLTMRYQLLAGPCHPRGPPFTSKKGYTTKQCGRALRPRETSIIQAFPNGCLK